MKPAISIISVFLGLGLAAWGYLACKTPQPVKQSTVPAGAAAGDLTRLDECEFNPGKKKTTTLNVGL